MRIRGLPLLGIALSEGFLLNSPSHVGIARTLSTMKHQMCAQT